MNELSQQIIRSENYELNYYPDITFIIPAYNEEKRISYVIDDLSNYIGKNKLNWNIITSIDGTDNTKNIVNDYSSKYNYLKNIENEIISRSSNNGDVNNLTNLRGLGIINSAIIVSEIGNIEQFESALKLQSYAGKCPDIEGSGGKIHSKGITHVRNKFLSNAVYESAISLVMNKNKEFYDIFNREIGKKKSNVQAYIAVSKRLLFHIYSIMKNHNFKKIIYYYGFDCVQNSVCL